MAANSNRPTSVADIVVRYRNFTGQQLQDSWNQIYKHGVKVEFLRDILMYYFQHSSFPPPQQIYYDTLLMALGTKGTSKKTKIMIFQIIEEICSSLESNILETVHFTANSNQTIDLLNSLLIGGFVPQLNKSSVEQFVNLLSNETLNSQETGTLLVFVSQLAIHAPSLMQNNYQKGIGETMAGWLCNTRASQSSSQFFSRLDKFGGTEVDGTQLTPGDIFTVLTLANNFSQFHLMGVHTFSILREWLERVEQVPDESSEKILLFEFVREYCRLAVRQCLRTAHQETDRALQKAVLCEVLYILKRLVQLDLSQRMQALLIVKRIQGSVSDQFRSDPRDVSILVAVVQFYISFGEVLENSNKFFEYFFSDIVQRSFTSGIAAYDIASLLTDEKSYLEPSLFHRFFPNLLKLVACHPASLVEEYIQLVPLFIEQETAVEVLHSLLDLPTMSATLCVHQVTVACQIEKSMSLSPVWTALIEHIRMPEFRDSYNYLLRKEANPNEENLPTHSYLKILRELSHNSLIVTCSQIVPLLLDAFFEKVKTIADIQLYKSLLRTILKKLRLLYNVPGYSSAVLKNITEHVQEVLHCFPSILCALQLELTEYFSILDNSEPCVQLYTHLVWSVGAYASSAHSDLCTTHVILKFYETLECVLYEMLARIISEETVSLNLLNVMSSTLAKLASRSQDLIPRLLLCFSKVQRQITSIRLPNITEDDKQVVQDRMDELISFLKNPNITSPSVVSSTSHEVDPAISALLQILAQVTIAPT